MRLLGPFRDFQGALTLGDGPTADYRDMLARNLLVNPRFQRIRLDTPILYEQDSASFFLRGDRVGEGLGCRLRKTVCLLYSEFDTVVGGEVPVVVVPSFSGLS